MDQKELIESIAHKAAQEAVNRTLTSIGVDPSNPIEAQEHFHSMRRIHEMMKEDGFAEDLAFARKMRTAVESVQVKTWSRGLWVLFTSGTVAAIILGWRAVESFFGSLR